MEHRLYQGKKALVLGLGVSGRAAANFLIHHGALVQGVDTNEALINEDQEIAALKQAGMQIYLERNFIKDSHHFDFDMLILSPGISPAHPICQLAKKASVDVLGEIELGCRSIRNPLIGITGTNGKTTVTLLVNHILNHNGKKARALGNIGSPLTKELLTVDPEEILVIELSSYQLETLRQPVLDAAAILNITPDHLDRYSDMIAYAKAKFSIQHCLKKNKKIYIEHSTFEKYKSLLTREKAKTYGYSSDCFIFSDKQDIFIEKAKAFSLLESERGKISHDTENMMAAYALCQEFGVAPDGFQAALRSFKKPPHRIEFVRAKDGIAYYDDSKGTNIDAVIRAVQSLPAPIILLAGGVDKGAAYTPWIEAFSGKVKCICAIGQAAGKIYEQLSNQISVTILLSLEEAVQWAAKMAKPGDCILLSPGCASFDMFRDYAHRGEVFQRTVWEL